MTKAISNPSITVVLPVYNGIEYLKTSVESVLSQEYNDFELLILDDCSSDGSWEYLNTIKDERVKLFRNTSNKKLFYNLNFLCNNAKSPLIKIWAQDDILLKNALTTIVEFHNTHPDVGFSYVSCCWMDEEGKINRKMNEVASVLYDTIAHAKMCFKWGSISPNISNVTIVRNAFEKVGGFNDQMLISGDFDMWVKISKFYKVGFINVHLVHIRDHANQLSRNVTHNIKHIEEDYLVYTNLFSYVSKEVVSVGKREMRKTKLLYYYALMINALLRMGFKQFLLYWKVLRRFDSPVILTYYYARRKVLKFLYRLFGMETKHRYYY